MNRSLMNPARRRIRGFIAWLCVVALALSLAQTVSARPHKLRVSDPAQAAQLQARGARLLVDYGSFQVFEMEAAATLAANASQVEAADDWDFIELNAGPLDTRAPAVLAQRKAVQPAAGRRLHLVQFVGPTKPEWLAELEAAGVRVVHYIPQNAYLIQGDSAALAAFQAWAATNTLVQWEGAYAADYRIHPKARTVDAQGNPQTPATDSFTVQLLEDAVANADTLMLIDQLKLAPIQQQFRTLHYLNVVVRLPAERLAEIAARPELISIQPHLPRHLMDERQDQIMAGNLTGSLPTGAGYLAWLAAKGFTQEQFAASGFVVDVSDSGIDNGTLSPGHFGLYQAGDPGQGSRVAYARLEGTANSGSTLQGCDGHGNLNSHIIAGFNDRAPGFPHTDAAGFHYGLGVCPFVKVGSSVVFDTENFTSPNYANLQARAYRDGARVSNNSWGADTAGDYDADAQSYDALVRDAQPSGSSVANTGNQQMVIVFAAGNAGPSASTVGSPGTAKNVIVVGAAENVHSHSTSNGGNRANGNDGCSTPDSEADSANDLASFSSRGPCADGRKKPDLVAPGTHITGGVGQSVLTTNGTGTAISCFNGTGVCALSDSGTQGSTNNYFPLGQQFYTTSSGTSHSTPAVAGACALLRQYFINQSLTPPSPALTKAFLVNAARYMTGTYAGDTLPSSNQGMGAVNLGMAFDGVARILRDQASADKFTASGQTRLVNGSVVDPAQPFRVTLAWTDAPGSTTGKAYNNNLDLTVTINGQTYKGNVFSGATSIPGGTADAKNNLESVFLPAGVSGSFVVTVTAANINSDGVPNEAPTLDQDYALVIYNGTESSSPVFSTEPQSQSAALGSPVTFSAQAVGQGTIGYQWQFNGSLIADATNSSYTIGSVQTTDAGSYSVVATNAFGSATSAVATLTVVVAPVIVVPPASLSVVTGSAAGFSVTAMGAPPLNYQWQFNGTPIDGALASSYTVANAQTNDQGAYSVIVSNYAGSVTSAPALLTVYSGSAKGVVISQIYGGGGNSGAIYRNDYVELFNAGGLPVNLNAWSVQYASATGSSWSQANLGGTLPPGQYYLVQLASGGANGAPLPGANATNTGINISASAGKLALLTNQIALSGANPLGNSAIADFVGYGTAGAYEGTGPAPGGGVASAILRKNNGMTDTGDNAADFLVGTPNPRASTTVSGTIDLALSLTHAGNFTQGDTADTYTLVVANVGTLATTGMVTVVDTLPAGLTATALSGTGWSTSLGTLTCTRADALAPGASYPAITLTVAVATNAPASVTNVASVTTGGDLNGANNTASDVTPIAPSGGGGPVVGSTNLLAGWDVSGQSNYGTSPLAPSTNAAHLTLTGLTRGPGVTTAPTAASRAWGGNGFTSTTAAAAITAGDYVTFSFSANAGYQVSFSAISRYDYRRSNAGPPTGVWQYQVGTGAFASFATNAYTVTSSGGASLPSIDLSTIAALQNVGAGTNVTFRLVNYGATDANGTWYVYDYANSAAPDLVLQGAVLPVSESPAMAPVLSLPSLVGNEFRFTLSGSVGSNYVIETTTGLPGAWTPVLTSPAPIQFHSSATNSQQFYRGKVLP